MKDPVLILSEYQMEMTKADKQLIYRTITAWLTKALYK